MDCFMLIVQIVFVFITGILAYYTFKLWKSTKASVDLAREATEMRNWLDFKELMTDLIEADVQRRVAGTFAGQSFLAGKCSEFKAELIRKIVSRVAERYPEFRNLVGEASDKVEKDSAS